VYKIQFVCIKLASHLLLKSPSTFRDKTSDLLETNVHNLGINLFKPSELF